MSRLTIWDTATEAQILATEDQARIAAELQAIGVRFEQWPVAELPADADADAILAAYRPRLDAFLAETSAGSADVIKLTPDHPMKDALRTKFCSEHTHTEDEVRFFHSGAGNFVLHMHGRVYDARCTAGDLISVPAHVTHWFDAGDAPDFAAVRVFTDTTGWTPHYTGTDMAVRFPAAT